MTARNVTIEDVAALAGVSRAAVSKVLRNAYGVSEPMQQRVQAAIDELGYRPRVAARAMRGTSYTLGVELPTMANPFLQGVLGGLIGFLETTRYSVIIAPSDAEGNSSKAIQTLLDYQVAGLVTIGANATADWLETQATRCPMVMLGRHDESVNYDTVGDDDALGARLAVDHLYSLGHRRITHLTIGAAEHPHMSRSSHAMRARSYRQRMRRYGLTPDTHIIASPTEESAYASTLGLLEQPTPPTAIFAGHDELALGVMRAAAQFGLGRSELSIVGYDDSTFASHPLISLTTVRQSSDEVGKEVGSLLLQRIGGRTEAAHTVITPELQVRGSSAPPSQTT